MHHCCYFCYHCLSCTLLYF